MKTKTLLLILLSVTTYSFSQVVKPPTFDGKSFSIAGDFDRILGDLNDRYHYGLGGTIKLEIPVRKGLNLTGSAGYQVFMPDVDYQALIDNYHYNVQDYKFIPVEVGARYYLTAYFYSEVQAGVVISADSKSNTGFGVAPGIGISFPVRGRHGIDLGLRYESWTVDDKSYNPPNNVNSFLGLRLAYKFGI